MNTVASQKKTSQENRLHKNIDFIRKENHLMDIAAKVLSRITKLNQTTYKKGLYSTTKWDLSEECKVESTYKNQSINTPY